MAEVQTTDIRAVQRNVLRYSLAGLVTIAILSAVFVMVPMYGQLHKASETSLGHIAQSRADAIHQILDRAKTVAQQVSSRVGRHNIIEDFAAGRIEASKMASVMEDVFKFAMAASHEIVGIQRLDLSGNPIFSHGQSPPQLHLPENWFASENILVHGPDLIDGIERLLVSSPIINADGDRIGTDIVTFSIEAIYRLFRQGSDLGKSGQALLLHPSTDGIISTPLFSGEALSADEAASIPDDLFEKFVSDSLNLYSGVIEYEDYLLAHIPVIDSELTLVLQLNANEVFGALNNNLIFAAIGVLGLVLLGMCGLFLVVSPMTSRVESLSSAMETQLQLALDNMPNGLCMFDEDLRFATFNRVFQNMYQFEDGFLKKGMRQRDSFTHFLSKGLLGEIEDTEASIEAREQMVRQGRGHGEHNFADGRIIDVQFGDWTDGYIVGVYTDVTERKKAEQRLAESETRMREILEASPISIAIVDLETWERLYANPASLNTMGVDSMDELLGKSILNTHSEKDSLLKMREIFDRDGRVDNYEVKRKKADGVGTWWALANWRPITYEGRNAYIVWNLDITARKETEQQIAENEARLRRILEDSPLAVSINEIDSGTRLFGNDRLATILGADKLEDILHMGISSSYVDKGWLTDLRQKFKTEGRIDNLEAERYRIDGKTKWWALTNWRAIRYQGKACYNVWTLDITERKEAEQALASQTAVLQSTFDNMPMGLAVYDQDLRFVEVNPQYYEVWDITDEQVSPGDHLGDAIKILAERGDFGELSAAGVSQAIKNRIAKATNGSSTFEHNTTDGRTIEVRHSVWSGDRMVAIFNDITGRKQAEERIARQSSILRSTLDNMPSGLTVFDENMTHIALNDQFSKILGFAPGEVKQGSTAWDSLGLLAKRGVYGEQNRNRAIVERLETIRAGSTSAEIELDNGNIISARYGDWSGGYLVGMFDDITAQKRAEKEIAMQSAILQSTQDNMPSGLVVMDSDLTIIEHNAPYAELWGLPEDFFHPNTRLQDIVEYIAKRGDFGDLSENQLDFAISTRVETVRAGNTSFEHQRIDGRVIQVNFGEWSDGYLVGVFIDVTEQKAAERALTEAKQAAEEANEAKSSFLANMSHEIRTPLNAIIGLTRLARRTDMTPQQEDYLSKVQSSSQSLLGIINDILDFSKIEAGKLDIEAVQFGLDNVLEDLAAMMLTRVGDKPIEMHFRTDPEIPLDLIGDPLRLGQILINLVTNAIKFTDKGEILVSAKFLNLKDDRVQLRFEITDSGIGMTESQVQKLFQPFTQADVSTTRKFGGTGLGLAISQRLVELIDGEIGVNSQPGNGSTFWFTGTFGRSTAQDEHRLVPSPDVRGTRILIVDDNETAQVIFKESLDSMTFSCTAVGSGEAALNALTAANSTNKSMNEAPFGLVILDWQMPGMDGIETARRIAALDDLAERPVITMVTAHGDEGLQAHASKVGVASFLVKPVNQSTLFDAVMQALATDTPTSSRASHRGSFSHAEEQVAGLHVLLVEDNEINQQVASELLRSADVKVDIANNGRIAVDMVHEQTYGAVLMDLQMPEMDGYEATQIIRGDARFNDLPIIAMTAHAMAAERDRCLAIGMNDHITKPIDPDHLFGALARWAIGQGVVIESKPSKSSGKTTKKTPKPKSPAKSKDTTKNSKPKPQVDSDTLPATISGIDMDGARAMLRSNETLLRRLLSDFHAKYMHLANSIAEDLAKGDVETAQRTAHTLKGVSGNIQAMAVFEAAKSLDQELRDDHESKNVERLVSELSAALDEVRLALDVALASPDAKKSPAKEKKSAKSKSTRSKKHSYDSKKAKAIISDLQRLLADNDMSAGQKMEDLRGLLDGAHDEAMTEAEILIGDLEYERAADAINALQAVIV